MGGDAKGRGWCMGGWCTEGNVAGGILHEREVVQEVFHRENVHGGMVHGGCFTWMLQMKLNMKGLISCNSQKSLLRVMVLKV